MDTEGLKRLCALDAEKKRLNAELKKVKEERAVLEPLLMESFVDEGVDSIKVAGKTIYLHRTMRARGNKEHGETVWRTLNEVGLSDCVMVGVQRLAARVREYKDADEFFTNYPDLQGLVIAEDAVSVRTRGV